MVVAVSRLPVGSSQSTRLGSRRGFGRWRRVVSRRRTVSSRARAGGGRARRVDDLGGALAALSFRDALVDQAEFDIVGHASVAE